MAASSVIPVIDIFAGPGGLGEGFSAFQAESCHPFRVALSIEKDTYAHATLCLRSFYRQFSQDKVPEQFYDVLRQNMPLHEFPDRLKEKSPKDYEKWCAAEKEAFRAELGASDEVNKAVSQRIRTALGENPKAWVLIGGPPCQAYSIVGRSRNKGNSEYRIEDDKRSSLYRQYLKIIADHSPTVFVMENVKGLLSATVENQKIFEKIMSDLQCPDGGKTKLRYRVVPIVVATDANKYTDDDPRRFIVRCEEYGVPQQRHRVILIGLIDRLKDVVLPPLSRSVAPTVMSVIDSLPRLRSGLSRSRRGSKYEALADDADSWLTSIHEQIGVNGYAIADWVANLDEEVQERIVTSTRKVTRPHAGRGGEFVPASHTLDATHSLYDFLVDERLGGVCNHSTRSHLDTDLARYMFCAAFAREHDRSPRLEDFPRALLPQHKNASTGHFNDRFRVQIGKGQATTITSHISKDGHYFIHYDPTQCRSLTVREAARLQTFPDNYFFCGPRTQQYMQVGNAVPPWIAKQIAQSIFETLVEAGIVD